eukprot:m.232964 g.232964  ORF g.232964 m.232964 type:complete len:291 (-) comp18929_c0_seq1:18-890(-)
MEGFDDSLFEDAEPSRTRRGITIEPYSPRQATPNWFFEATPTPSVTDFDLMRFQGDALYLRKEFAKALELSKKALALVAAYQGTAPQVQRVKEWTDMAARCALRLGALEEAEHYAVERMRMDHVCDILGKKLAAEVFVAQGRFEEAASLYHQCLPVQPGNVDVWLALARCFERLQPIALFTLLRRAALLWARAWTAVAANAARDFAKNFHQGRLYGIDELLSVAPGTHSGVSDDSLHALAVDIKQTMSTLASPLSPALTTIITTTFLTPAPLPLNEEGLAEPEPSDKGDR